MDVGDILVTKVYRPMFDRQEKNDLFNPWTVYSAGGFSVAMVGIILSAC